MNRNIKILLTLVWFQFLSNLSRIAFLVGKHRSSKEARFIVDSFAQKRVCVQCISKMICHISFTMTTMTSVVQ